MHKNCSFEQFLVFLLGVIAVEDRLGVIASLGSYRSYAAWKLCGFAAKLKGQ
jgi:hypothetical protein